MDLKEEREKKIWIIILSIILIGIIIYNVFFASRGEAEKIDTETISIVTDANDFYTVSSCISKYFSYLSSNDTENLLILLSSQYKKDNSIDSSNLYDFIGRLDGTYNFNPRKMYVQQIGKSVYKYYVKGSISKDQISGQPKENDYYIIVIMDRQNTTFAIEMYSGDMFK